MGVKTTKATSPGRRFYSVSDFVEITKDEPERSLIEKQNSTGGRNNHGRITSRFRGGGHKQRYRGKERRMGRGYAKLQNWKKAIITLKEGDQIQFFDSEG